MDNNIDGRNIPVSTREAMQSFKYSQKAIRYLDLRELIIYPLVTRSYDSALETVRTSL